MSNNEWIRIINHLVGTPFEWGARGPVAYDCWGLVVEVMRLAGRPVPGDWTTEDAVSASKIMEGQIASPLWVRTHDTPEPLDVVAMSTHRLIHHVGVATPFGILTTTRELGAVHEIESKLRQQGYRRLEYYRWAG